MSGIHVARMEKAILNATATAEVPSSIIFQGNQNGYQRRNQNGYQCLNQSCYQRLSYGVFLYDSLFLTPETNCDEFGVISLILSVNTNVSIGNHSEGIILTFQHLEQVLYCLLL